jgi:hypothetical protein
MSTLSSTPRPPGRRPSVSWLRLAALAALPLWCAACASPRKADTPKGAAAPQARPAPVPVASTTPAPVAAPKSRPGEISLFDGKTLTGWKESDFAGRGEVEVKDGRIVLGTGVMTGITWTNEVPTNNYEISLEAMRVEGSDFFCALTFPVGQDPCSFIVGGWGGGVVGLSSLDGEDASSNETTKYLNFENGKWFAIRLRVTPEKIQAWIDNDPMVDIDATDKKFSIRLEVEPSKPLGIATWSTTGALRNLRLRRL